MRAQLSRHLLLLLVLACGNARADLHVIVNANNPNATLTPQQVSEFYLGRTRSYASGGAVMVYDHPSDSGVRERYMRSLMGMTLPQVNAYWARLTFTGRMLPPKAVDDDEAMIEMVKRNPGAIGYVEKPPSDGSVKVVLRLKE